MKVNISTSLDRIDISIYNGDAVVKRYTLSKEDRTGLWLVRLYLSKKDEPVTVAKYVKKSSAILYCLQILWS